MTAPLSYPPRCLLYIDGARFADGQPGEPDSAPVALTDLRVTWGRSSTLDQPTPATCTFQVLDMPGGLRFLEQLKLGSRVEVRADATVYPDPTVSTIPLLYPGPVQNGAATGSGTATVALRSTSANALTALIPPRQLTSDPSGWDAVPRALAGQTWRLQLNLALPAPFAGWHGWAATVTPVAYWAPKGNLYNLLTQYTTPVVDGVADLTFVPLTDSWQGFQLRVWPTGPAWADLDDTRWIDLAAVVPAATLTNLCTNPTPASVTGWVSNSSAKYAHTYAAGEITVTRSATGDPDVAASALSVGLSSVGVYNPVLPAGVNYQRSVEVWVDQAGSVLAQVAGGFTTGQALPANQWTRVVQQFAGSGIAQYVMCLGVKIVGVGTGAHVKFRRSQLIANPGGLTLPYFDGSTPDAPPIDYAWTGTANASTSTATDTTTGSPGDPRSWDALGTFTLSAVQMLAPAAGAGRLGSVFSGRITDMEARYDSSIGGTVVACTAQDDLAELANRYVGSTPWAQETLNARFGKIVTASGQVVNWTVDAAVQSRQVTYRDVDNQPAATLLQELAQSVAGALWAATSVVSGPFLFLEDISSRSALFVLAMGADSLVHIVISDSVVASGKAVELSACDVLLDPVRWAQDSTDASTRVDVTWKEQTANPTPPPAIRPTDRTVSAVDAEQEAATGQRRVAVSTQLAVQADAQQVADSLLGRLSTPGWRIAGLTWRAELDDELDAVKLSTIMQILDGATRLGLGMILTDLPEWSPATDAGDQGLFLEGGTFTNLDGAWILELLTSSAASQGVSAAAWSQLPAGWRWVDFDPDISWSDLAGVGI